ncbi:MAG: hypothetical protein IKW74_02000, partial [Thermoguttaceae bacterium]|nr:hypothetical protein [Thermoguttaceae bacterium]
FGQKRTADRGASVSFEEGRTLGSGFLCWIALIIIILSFVGGVSGCNSLKLNRKSCLFSKNREGADTLSNSKEDELVKNASAMSASESPRKSEKMETAPAATNQTAPIAWSAQRPNGGVLFPKTLSAKGPLVVLEPKSIIAPVGSEVVMVASYIGEDNEYLRVNEKLEWELSGAGIFLTTNPENCCLDGNTKKISDHNLKTTTSAKLWRIHRGTATPTDDISILKGQSWTTVQSGVEGTSSVCVLAPNIDNWQNRTATSVIHWIDAAFLYPRSGIAPVGEQQIFTTTVQRKSSPSEGRMGWTVRYEVLSGPAAGFGPEISPILETQTDQNGQSQVVLSQRENVAGLNKILVKIIRPGSATDSPIVVDQRIINQAWTDNSPFRLRIQGTSSVKVGEVASYQIQVTNLTSFAQNGILTLPIPANGVFVAGTPQPLLENNMAIWIMNDIPANSTQDVTVQIRSQADGGFDIVPTIRRQEATVTPKSGANTTPGGGTVPPVTIPGAELNSGPAATPTPPPTTSPVTTPQTPTSTDPASQTPTLPDTGTAGGVGDSGQVEIRFMRPFPATAKQGEVFDGYFTLINPQNLTVNDIVITSLAPEGVDYVSDEAGVLNRSFVKTTPQPLADIVGRQYRLAYQTQNTGTQEIKIQIMDTSNKVYASTSIFVTILPVEVTANKVPAESSEVPPVTFNSSHGTGSDNQNNSENNNGLKIDTTEPESTVNKNPVTSGDAENNGNPAGRNDLDGRTDNGHQTDHTLKNNVVKPAETMMTSSGSDSA